MLQEIFGDAADHEPLHTPSLAGAHDNDVRLFLAPALKDASRHCAVDGRQPSARRPQADLGNQRPEFILGATLFVREIVIARLPLMSPEARRVGKECFSTCRSRWPTVH